MPEGSRRLFVGIAPDESALDEIAAYQNTIRERTAGFRWIRRSALHLTLKFLGPTPERHLEEVSSRLQRQCLAFRGGEITIENAIALPRSKRARVIGLTARAPKSLQELAAALNGAFADLEIPPESRAFLPHITIARCRGRPQTLDLTEMPPPPPVSFSFQKAVLFESRLKPAGAEYLRLVEAPVADEGS